MGKTILSILIPTLRSRKDKLERLMKLLRPQLLPDMEVLIDADQGEVSIGVKRNRLLARAIGEYVVSIDDDDTISSDYIQSIMEGISKGVDCVSCPGILYENGVELGDFINKPHQSHVVSRVAGKYKYMRAVGHLNAMKRDIAARFTYPDSSYGEDYDWSSAIERSGLIVTCHDIDHPIYFYDYWPNKPDSRKICNLAIVMPVLNHVYTTQRCVESLISATKDANFRLILVDDCSDPVSEVSDYADALYRRLSFRFHYIRNPVNRGVNASWNIGIATARSLAASCIAVVNNDILFSPGWDTPLVEALKDESVGVISPLSTFGPVPLDWPRGTYRDVNPAGYRGYMPLLGACFAATAANFGRIQDLSESLGYVGVFPEAMRIYFGDNWLASAMQHLGLQCGYDDTSYIHHLFCKTTSKIDSSQVFRTDGEVFLELERRLGRHMDCFAPPPEGTEAIRPNADSSDVVRGMMDFMSPQEVRA